MRERTKRAFKSVAEALLQVHGPGKVEYIPFPGDLKNRLSALHPG